MEKVTWEPESTMRAQYLQFCNSGINFKDEIPLKRGGGGGGGGGERENCNTPNYTLVVL